MPEYDVNQSQRSRSPSPTPPTDHAHHRGDESAESGEDDEIIDNIHIVELHKGTESLGVYLTHYTSPDGRYTLTHFTLLSLVCMSYLYRGKFLLQFILQNLIPHKQILTARTRCT